MPDHAYGIGHSRSGLCTGVAPVETGAPVLSLAAVYAAMAVCRSSTIALATSRTT